MHFPADSRGLKGTQIFAGQPLPRYCL